MLLGEGGELDDMPFELIHSIHARVGDKVAVLSPSFAAPAVAPAVHEQAMRRLTEITGLFPVEYPTTRQLGASPQARAADLMAAFADPDIRAVLATVGGEDQITVIPHLDADIIRADPKPFLGYSDNTNLLSWLWTQGVCGYYGGSTQVHLGPGTGVDPIHAASLRAALITGEWLEITDPQESEDIGKDWNDPAALVENGDRETTGPRPRHADVVHHPRPGRMGRLSSEKPVSRCWLPVRQPCVVEHCGDGMRLPPEVCGGQAVLPRLLRPIRRSQARWTPTLFGRPERVGSTAEPAVPRSVGEPRR